MGWVVLWEIQVILIFSPVMPELLYSSGLYCDGQINARLKLTWQITHLSRSWVENVYYNFRYLLCEGIFLSLAMPKMVQQLKHFSGMLLLSGTEL